MKDIATGRIMSCDTCVYRIRRGEYAKCGRFTTYCAVERKYGCKDFNGWEAKPLRRSFAQWFYDTFLKVTP